MCSPSSGAFQEIRERKEQIEAFYAGKMADPLDWLLDHDVRYVLWLVRDNANQNVGFAPMNAKIRSHYCWHRQYGDDLTFSVGYWERFETPPAH